MVWLSVFIFIFGLCVGSFLNVLIYRLPRALSISGRSLCPKCKKRISWSDNLPLVSFILLGGKCRFCHSPISGYYPTVEFLTGVMFVLIVILLPGQNFKFQISNIKYFLDFSFYLILISALIVIFFTDLRYQVIPDQIIYPAIFIAFLYQLSNFQFAIYNYLLVAVVAGLFFLCLHLLTRGRGMGLGDVKLAFLMGLILGFPKVVLALYLAFLTGAFFAVILILTGKKKFGQEIPFGPFLTGATLSTLFWGEPILKWITARFF